jgi:hypothetical protein
MTMHTQDSVFLSPLESESVSWFFRMHLRGKDPKLHHPWLVPIPVLVLPVPVLVPHTFR